MTIKDKKRTLVVDAQLFQSYSFHRGIGKYSFSLLEALQDKLSMYDHKILVFNESSKYLNDTDMGAIKDATEGFSYVYLDLELLDDASQYGKVRSHNKTIIDTYINDHLTDQSVDYLILSLFQETEVPVFPTVCNNRYLIIYDLIPLQFFDPYLKVEHVASNYLSRFDTLVEADHFFTISGSVASDLSLNLGIPKKNITPIYGAPVERRKIATTAINYLADAEIILLPSGDDYRKNNVSAVEAFDRFNKLHGEKYTLVVTSAFTESTKGLLQDKSKRVVFTGNVSESELAWLYDRAKIVFFPSQSEGLGLPVLEAIEFGKRVVCSDIVAFREISSSILSFCDPYKVSDMEKTLGDALVRDAPSKDEIAQVLARYNWGTTAGLVSGILGHNAPNDRTEDKYKVAVFSPKPSGFSGIGKVVQDQHYVLSRVADVTYFFEDGVTERAQSTEIRKNYLRYAAPCGDVWAFDENEAKKYDRVMYHIGNGEYHVATLVKALAFPDQVILHDTRIRGLYGVVRDLGMISHARYDAEEKLTNLVDNPHGDFLTSLVNKQKRVITHSDYAAKAVKYALLPDFGSTVSVRLQLAVPASYFVDFSTQDDVVYVSMAGVMTESKGLSLAEEITKIKFKNKKLKVKIFGFSMLDDKTLQALERNRSIELIQSPSDTRYIYELSQTDIMLNFRDPYHGETSYSTLEGLRFGKDVIINDMGWFAELPEKLVHKITSSTQIVDTIKKIVGHPSDETAKEERVAFIEGEYNIGQYIQALVDGGRSK